MEPLYSTVTNYTYQEYKRFTWSLLLTRSRVIWYIVLEVLMLLLGYLLASTFYIVFAVLYPVLIVILQNRHIKKIWKSNKVAQNLDVKLDFYDTYLVDTTGDSCTKLEYNKLHKIVETKTNFYLLISKVQGVILNKANFPEGLADFLRSITISE